MKKTLPLLVHLKKEGQTSYAAANFGESIVNLLRNSENAGFDADNEIFVHCETSETTLNLSGFCHANETSQSILLRRPPFCPINSLNKEPGLGDIPSEIRTRGVHVGVSVILESSDNNVLITRRAKTMRTFPHVWVPPGGHVDHGESLSMAGMRELHEETGIKIKNDDNSPTSILGLWESTFPPMRHLGLPKRHHIVVYLHHKLKQTAANISKAIELETNEVDACAWVCSCVAEDIVATDHQFLNKMTDDTTLKQCRSFPNLCVKQSDYIDGVLIKSGGKVEKGRVISTAPLFADVGLTNDNERVSTGTKYALKLWLDFVKSKGS